MHVGCLRLLVDAASLRIGMWVMSTTACGLVEVRVRRAPMDLSCREVTVHHHQTVVENDHSSDVQLRQVVLAVRVVARVDLDPSHGQATRWTTLLIRTCHEPIQHTSGQRTVRTCRAVFADKVKGEVGCRLEEDLPVGDPPAEAPPETPCPERTRTRAHFPARSCL